MRLAQVEHAHIYAESISRHDEEYDNAIASGSFWPLSFPWSSLNAILLIVGLYIALLCPPSASRLVRLTFWLSILSTSVWSVFRYRSPGVVGSLGVGLNGVMITAFATNFLLLRDPRQIRRATPIYEGHKHRVNGTKPANTGNDSIWKWQGPPDKPRERLCWITDLIACLRALKWGWDPREGKELPPAVAFTREHSLRRHIINFCWSYLGLDIIKCIMMEDPHFLGDIACPAPPHLIHLLPWSLHTYRMLLPAVGIVCSIQFYFTCWAIIQMAPGPRILGINGTPIMYPAIHGSPAATLSHGLRGFWGRTWHQMFRAHFQSIGDALAKFVAGLSEDKKTLRSGITICIVFALSGILHGCGSYTMLGATRPQDAFAFFALQPVGIGVQFVLASLVKTYVPGHAQRVPVQMAANLAFAFFWLWATFWLLADDFSRGGMWLFEPVPVSFVRGLGLSSQDTRWLPHFGSPG